MAFPSNVNIYKCHCESLILLRDPGERSKGRMRGGDGGEQVREWEGGRREGRGQRRGRGEVKEIVL